MLSLCSYSYLLLIICINFYFVIVVIIVVCLCLWYIGWLHGYDMGSILRSPGLGAVARVQRGRYEHPGYSKLHMHHTYTIQQT